MDHLEIRRDSYLDSVFLMAASAELARLSGLEAGHLVLATAANRQLLEQQGFDPQPLQQLGPTDLVIALRAARKEVIAEALQRIEALLHRSAAPAATAGAPGITQAVSLEDGLARLPGATLALISVPGDYATYEARRALERGLHVMLFSDNVPLEQELALKQRAAELGLLVMGPDCGTALVQGKPIGFANCVRPGAVGLVGASGTGLQEVSCQLHRLGNGISHMLGTGGRDLSAAVGGRTMLAALELLGADPQTRVLVVISKPPAYEIAERVIERLVALGKPAVVCFLGGSARPPLVDVHFAADLATAAWLAHCLERGQPTVAPPDEALRHDPRAIAAALRPAQRLLHGLFTGGTLGGEALLVLRRELGQVYSNLSAPALGPDGHTVIDLGDDLFPRGKPHPMIDPAPRCAKIVELGSAPSTAVLLLDVVLGYGSHPNPAGGIVEALAQARASNPMLVTLASITGTDLDYQGLASQQRALEGAGALVLPSNASAARFAARIIRAREEVQP